MNREKKHLSAKNSVAKPRQTTRKNVAVEALRASEAKYRGFIENLAVMFYAAEPNPPYAPIYISPAFAQFGYSLEEWSESADMWTRVLHPDDREWVLEKTETAMRAGAETDYEYRIVAQNGEVYWVRDRGSFVRDKQGNPFCWQGIIIDVTERKQAEKSLRESEAQFKSAFEDAAVGMAISSLDGRWMQVNQQLCDMLGYTKDELLNRRFTDLTYLDDISADLNSKARFISGEIHIYQREKRYIHKNGSLVWVYLNVSLVRGENGEPVYFIAEMQNISERKQAEEALTESERRYRQMFEKNQAIKLIIDADTGAIVDVNSAACRFYGFDCAEFKTKRISEINVLPAEQVISEMQQAVEEQRNYFLFRHRLASGEVRDVEVNSSPLRDRTRNLLYSIVQDVTERKRAEQALKESEARYRDIFENANDLIYVHDLEGNYLSINKATERVIGYSSEEALKLNMRQVIAPEHLDDSRSRMAEKLAGKERQTVYEIVCLTKDGRRLTLEINSSVIYRDGEPIAVQGIARDVTERKRTEAVLKKHEDQYRELFENANDLIYTRDLDGYFTSFNRAGEIITGYTREEVLKMNFTDILAPDYLEKARQINSRLSAGEPSVAYELEIISKDGRRIPMELSVRLITQDGKPVGIQGIARDITERKRSENALRLNEAKLKDLFDNAPLGYHELDKEGRIVRVNRTELEMLGYTSKEMLGRFVWEFVAEAVSRDSVLEKLSGRKVLETHERTFRRKDGGFIPILIEERLITDEDGAIAGIRSTLQNITERRQAENALVNSERRYRSLGEGIMHQVWTAQPDGKINYVNGRTLDYFGQAREQMINDGWQCVVHPEDLHECLKRWRHSLETGDDYETQYRLKRHDGEYRWHQSRATAGRADDGKIISWFGTNTDINDQKIAEAKLSYVAGHDTLTNLPNRAKFMSHLERAASRAECSPTFRFAVLFLDLDRFKLINDSLGHSVGDKLLIAIAERLEACVRPGDVIARLGGDEFTVLLTNINEPADAVRVAERFLEQLSAPFKLDAYEVFTSASIGIIVSDEIHRRPDDFLRDADTAMYRAKEAGKARYEIFDRAMHIRNMNLLEMENDLRKAIENEEFEVFYQPIVALETGEIRDFEALIRWQHPKHGMVMPNDFIGIAEETGLIIPIGEWILNEACRQTAEWRKMIPESIRLSISVNLSAKQLMHPNLTAQVREILKRTALNPRYLKLEVTESMVMENADKALSVTTNLSKLGISLSTDDFGTGYSSLSYLHRFPFDCIKIDRSFVSKMDSDQKSEAIVRTILLLGQNLHLAVTAEGIETKRQLEALRQLGCKTGQGYLFSKPVNAATATQLLQNGLPHVFESSLFNFNETNEQLLELDNIQ